MFQLNSFYPFNPYINDIKYLLLFVSILTYRRLSIEVIKLSKVIDGFNLSCSIGTTSQSGSKFFSGRFWIMAYHSRHPSGTIVLDPVIRVLTVIRYYRLESSCCYQRKNEDFKCKLSQSTPSKHWTRLH